MSRLPPHQAVVFERYLPTATLGKYMPGSAPVHLYVCDLPVLTLVSVHFTRGSTAYRVQWTNGLSTPPSFPVGASTATGFGMRGRTSAAFAAPKGANARMRMAAKKTVRVRAGREAHMC